MIRLEIAGLIIQLNMPIKLLHDNMYSFLYKGAKEADIYWEVKFDNKYNIEEKPWIKAKSLNIYNKNDIIVYEYKNDPNVPFMIVAKEGFSKCTFYLSKNYENTEKYTLYIEKYIKMCLFNVFREMFILACSYNNRLPMHSSTIIYNDKAYVFAAPSGVGKSTHAELWKKQYDCEILNGDIVIFQLGEDNKCIVHGCPWCGTSNIYSNKCLELGGIAFIQRSSDNVIYELDEEDVGMSLLENHFLPFIEKGIVDHAAVTINSLAKNIKGYLLECTAKKEAAVVAKKGMIKEGDTD